MVSPSPSPVPPVTGLSTADWIDPIKIVLGLIAGLWALYLYWRTRQGQARVAVEPMTRFVGGESANAALLVALRITNSSKVAFFYDSAIARLMDASSRAPDGTVVLVPFSEQDPFVPVYGAETGDSEAISQGRLFAIDPKEEIMLEPGEAVDTEMAFPLTSPEIGLLAMQVRIQGYQRRVYGWRWVAQFLRWKWFSRMMRGRLWVWASFFYIVPGHRVPEAVRPALTGENGPLDG
jgi:hypothetical protein